MFSSLLSNINPRHYRSPPMEDFFSLVSRTSDQLSGFGGGGGSRRVFSNNVINATVDGSPSPSLSLSSSAAAVASSSASILSREEKEDESETVVKSRAIFQSLDLTELWELLSECLQLMHEKKHLNFVVNALQPLIEAFFVVHRRFLEEYYNAKKSPSNDNNRTKTSDTIPMETESSSASSSSSAASQSLPLSEKEQTILQLYQNFINVHGAVLNNIVRKNPSLLQSTFFVLLAAPNLLEFDVKRRFFYLTLHKNKTRGRTLQLTIRRDKIIDDSRQQIMNKTAEDIKNANFSVRFKNEEGVDAGGVSREWFQVLSRELFNPIYGLFVSSAVDAATIQPNRSSWVHEDHLSYFRFVGRIIGKAIYDSRLLDCHFTRSFYKHMLGVPVDYRDMEALDPEYYKSLLWIKDNDVTGMNLTFSTDVFDYGEKKEVELIENGANIPVTQENKLKYIHLVTEMKLTRAIRDQIDAFLKGFYEIIPKETIQIFNEKELELLISGMPEIDVDDWKNNTEYRGYTSNCVQIQWFWRAVRSFTQNQRASLLQFVTGSSRLPIQGFSHLEGMHGVQKFTISKAYSKDDDRLPAAHTCFNQLDLPEYSSYEQLQKQLTLAMTEGGEGFGFA